MRRDRYDVLTTQTHSHTPQTLLSFIHYLFLRVCGSFSSFLSFLLVARAREKEENNLPERMTTLTSFSSLEISELEVKGLILSLFQVILVADGSNYLSHFSSATGSIPA